MRKAKIVCTIGPASESAEILEGLMNAGMDVARLNMSHSDRAHHGEIIRRIREVSGRLGVETAILLDLSGPKIRVGELKNPLTVKPGDEVVLTPEDVTGEGNVIPVRYPYLLDELGVGGRVYINDGLIHLDISGKEKGGLKAVAASGGVVLSRKGVNLPMGGDSLPSLTAKDEEDLRFGLKAGVDWVSLSFVRRPSDADRVRAVMEEEGVKVPLMAKIEKPQALENLAGIVEAFDGVMVARGDLGVEIPLEDLPGHQKRIIKLANEAAKPVVTATQMLLSMVGNERPTRAEVTDVANAILDGADAVMLSEETAMGGHPVEAASMMAKIAERAAGLEGARTSADGANAGLVPVDEAIGRATCRVAIEVGAKLIITPTGSGATARLIASRRPVEPVLAISPRAETVRMLAMTRGVRAVKVDDCGNTDELFALCRELAFKSGMALPGDLAVVTAGIPFGLRGSTNMLKVMVL